MQDSVPVIDAHAHVAPTCIEQVVRVMDENNVEALIDMTPSLSTPNEEKAFPGPYTIEEILTAFEKFPGRFVAFCGIDFDEFGTEGWLKREKEALARHVEAGAAGVKIWKTLGLETLDNEGKVIPVDDERLAPLLDYAQELGCILAFHIADPQDFFKPLTPDIDRYEVLQVHPEWWFGDRKKYPYEWWQLIRQLERVIERHRKGTIVGAHFGCAAEEIGYVADVMRCNPHYIVDIAARLQDIGRNDPSYILSVFTEFQDRILMATDVAFGEPFTPESSAQARHLWNTYREYFEKANTEIENPSGLLKWKLSSVGMSSDILDKIYRLNAKRYLMNR